MAQRALAVATTAKGCGFWGQSNQAWWPLVTTDHLSSLPPQAQAFAQQVSGLVAMKINEARVCWWRALQKWAETKHQQSDRWRNKHRMAAKKVSKLLMDWPWRQWQGLLSSVGAACRRCSTTDCASRRR
jgi:light-regulated signal transduction histidine kinase (bacteriophytochrome)